MLWGSNSVSSSGRGARGPTGRGTDAGDGRGLGGWGRRLRMGGRRIQLPTYPPSGKLDATNSAWRKANQFSLDKNKDKNKYWDSRASNGSLVRVSTPDLSSSLTEGLRHDNARTNLYGGRLGRSGWWQETGRP